MTQTRAALTLSLVLGSSLAHADTVQGTRSEQLRETSHVVVLTVDRGHATMSVRRTVKNGGKRHDQAMFGLALPDGAVATGLRTLGSQNGHATWFEAELLEAEAAAARYHELTGIGGYYPKDPALLSWRSQRSLLLQVFPVAPDDDKTIEYDLILPTTYSEGRDRFVLSGLGTKELAADVVVRPAHAGDALFADGEALDPGARLVIGPERSVEFQLARAAQSRLSGGLAVVPISADKSLVRPHLEVAPRLSELPVKADVVVVIDVSRSRTQDDVEASARAARAYLSHLGDASVSVLTFDREVRSRHADFVSAHEAMGDLEKTPIERRNGSHLDVALTRVAAQFDGRAAAPRRVVVFTDLLTRKAIGPGLVKRVLGKTGALVHLVALEDGSASITREDESPWASDVRSTGGLAWRAGASDQDDRVLAATFEELARPRHIDRLRYTFDRVDLESAATLGSSSLPVSMAEGEGFVTSKMLRPSIGGVRVTGELWAAPVALTIAPSEAEKKRWSALVFGSGHIDEMTEAEMAVVARRGHAVSPVTSLLAIEPGVRPSTEGLASDEGQGFIAHGRGSAGGSHHSSSLARFDPRRFLLSTLEKEWSRCGGKLRAQITLETTRREVAEVNEVATTDPAAGCLRDAVWNLDLPGGFRFDHQEWQITVGG